MEGYTPNHAGNGQGMYSEMNNVQSLPSEFDFSHQNPLMNPQAHLPGYDFQGDLDLFTNTQFFDLDMAETLETNSPTSEENPPQWARVSSHAQSVQSHHQHQHQHNGTHTRGQVDMLNGGDLHSMHNYFGQGVDPSSTTSSRHPSNAAFHHVPPTLPSNQAFHMSNIGSPTTPGTSGNSAGDKRKAEAVTDNMSGTTTPATGGGSTIEEASRLAAEEDKRRRNTAASARFRVKKKQREQALEKSAKEMTDRVTYLEQRVSSLETENKILKDLITEKSGQDVNIAELSSKIASAKEAAASAGAADSRLAAEKKREVKLEKANDKDKR